MPACMRGRCCRPPLLLAAKLKKQWKERSVGMTSIPATTAGRLIQGVTAWGRSASQPNTSSCRSVPAALRDRPGASTPPHDWDVGPLKWYGSCFGIRSSHPCLKLIRQCAQASAQDLHGHRLRVSCEPLQEQAQAAWLLRTVSPLRRLLRPFGPVDDIGRSLARSCPRNRGALLHGFLGNRSGRGARPVRPARTD